MRIYSKYRLRCVIGAHDWWNAFRMIAQNKNTTKTIYYLHTTYLCRLWRKVDFSHRNIVLGVNDFLIFFRSEFHVGKRQQILAIFHEKSIALFVRNHREHIFVAFMRIHRCSANVLWLVLVVRLWIVWFVFVFFFAYFCYCDTTSATRHDVPMNEFLCKCGRLTTHTNVCRKLVHSKEAIQISPSGKCFWGADGFSNSFAKFSFNLLARPLL